MNSWIVLFLLVMSVMMYQYLKTLGRKLSDSTYLWSEVRAVQGCRIVLGVFILIFVMTLGHRHGYTVYNWGSVA